MVKVSFAVGRCSRCGRELSRPRPADIAICDCYEYCPTDHGNGPYGTLMEAYIPDLTPNTYSPIVVMNGEISSDLKHLLRFCVAVLSVATCQRSSRWR